MRKRVCVLLVILLMMCSTIVPQAGNFVYDVSGFSATQIYADNFDGKTPAQIYADWSGLFGSTRTNTVSGDGWLTATWLPGTGVGYAFKQNLSNAKYEFDCKSVKEGTSTNQQASIILRTTDGGDMFGSLNPALANVDKGRGIAFHYSSDYNLYYGTHAVILIADAGGNDILRQDAARYAIPYPSGVNFLSASAHMTVYDLDNKILFYINHQPFAAISLTNLNEIDNTYSGGTVYDGAGNSLGNFTKKVRRSSNIAFAARGHNFFVDNFSIAAGEEEETISEIFDVTAIWDESLSQVYRNDFDGKTQAEIYADWGGAHASNRPNPVTSDGWLMADWDTTTGVGYFLKKAYKNAKYEFDIKTSGSGLNAAFGLRTASGAGGQFGGIASTDVSVGNGIGFYIYSSTYPGQVAIVIADAEGEILSKAPTFLISYPAGFSFTSGKHMDVYDFDDLILLYLEGVPFAAIKLDDYIEGYYHSGIVYDKTGRTVGSFNNKKVRGEGCFSITNRASTILLDNFRLSRVLESIEKIQEPHIAVTKGASYADALFKLPDRVVAVLEDGSNESLDVVWDEIPEEFDGDQVGMYKVKGTMTSEVYDLTGQDVVYADVEVRQALPVITEGKTEIYQFTPAKDQLTMGYIIKTKTGKFIVIDGGVQDDSPYSGFLFDYLKEVTGSEHPVIEAWFLSHIHGDHTAEIARIFLNRKDQITINNLYFNFPKKSWILANSSDVEKQQYALLESGFNSYYQETDYLQTHVGVEQGDMFVIDDITIDVMMVPDGTEGTINDTSIVLNLRADGQNILFLGDLAATHGDRLAGLYSDKLKSDIVQMAHHGQGGVNKNVYGFSAPKLCLWPTPNWVWENFAGIVQTKGWMEELGVKHHIVAGISGTEVFALPYDFTVPPVVKYLNENEAEIKCFKNEKIYLSAKKEGDDEFFMVSALYNGKTLIEAKVIQDAALTGDPILLFDLTGIAGDEYLNYTVKTFVWKAKTVRPVSKPFEMSGGDSYTVVDLNFINKSISSIMAEGVSLTGSGFVEGAANGLKVETGTESKQLQYEFTPVDTGRVVFEMEYRFVSGGGFDGFLKNTGENQGNNFAIYMVDSGSLAFGSNAPTHWLNGGITQGGDGFKTFKVAIDFVNGKAIDLYFDDVKQTIPAVSFTAQAFSRFELNFKPANEFYIKSINIKVHTE